DIDLAINLIQNPEYSVRIFNIERGGNKPRKDISKWSDIREKLGYFFDGLHRRVNSESVTEIIEQETLQGILGSISKSYSDQLSKDEWLKLIKGTADELGYATDRKQYKQNPDSYKG